MSDNSQEPGQVVPVARHIKDALEVRGWLQKDLAFVMGRKEYQITNLMSGRTELSPEIAQELGVVLGGGGEYWLRLDAEYRLSQTRLDPLVVRRSKIFNYPVKEMQKRRWIAEADKASDLEYELKRLLKTDDLDDPLSLFGNHDLPFDPSFKRTIKAAELNKPEQAWLARAIELATFYPAVQYRASNIEQLQKDLRRYAAKSPAIRKVPELLARYGIKFVIVEPLKNVKIDGASFWLDKDTPVIAMSLRSDNIGSFWFALMHEIEHIKNKDGFSFDDLQTKQTDDREKRANENAAQLLVPKTELETFIRTYSPRYSEARINNLATRLQIHPGIILGQLQHQGEISYAAFKSMVTKVRHLAVELAFTDGWGQPIPIPSVR
ncbi:MAG TPA: ImmA/IrrE family metallo-endopeptidase [Pyrinomonadaceae bacterium]|nr:ImmA/IrrE family metallo-endopeptidase [Pyrinomonadaceae bacterium]